VSASPKIAALDDVFPWSATGFRIAEFTRLLASGVLDSVMSTIANLDAELEVFTASYPDLAPKVRPYVSSELRTVDMAYINFLNNAAYYLEDLEDQGLPFVLTLYPGGGLSFDEPESLKKLDRVLGSALLRRVITTQPLVTEQLSARFPSVRVTELYGVPTNTLYFVPGAGARVDYPRTRGEGHRICFVAHRYSPDGADKGFEEFLSCAQRLRDAGMLLEVSIVGPWSESDVPTRYRDLPVSFVGPLPAVALREFFVSQHLLVSPNKPGVLAPGAFDGFPLTTTVEAALSGVAVAVSDELDQNRVFVDGRDAIIERPNGARMAERILSLVSHPGALKRMAQSGLRQVRRSHAPGRQLDVRGDLLRLEAELVLEERSSHV
jgi:glycosyltransferase involved in cell wall biosynthesis